MKENNTSNLYNVVSKAGHLPVYNWYHTTYNKIPSEYALKRTIDFDKLLKKYEKDIVMSYYEEDDSNKSKLTNFVLKLDEEGTVLISTTVMESVQSGAAFTMVQKVKSIVLFTKKFSEIEDTVNNLPFSGTANKVPTKIHTLSKDAFAGFYLKSLDVNYKKVNIDLHYNDDLKPVLQTVVSGLKSKKASKGLVVLYGAPGAGKTTLIRHLIKVIPDKKFVIVPSNLVSALTEPTFMDFLSRQKELVLVIEEAEQILFKRDNLKDSNPISNILNLSDGLLGDCLNFKIIVTFNTDLQKIDEALLRKGRLLAKYEFKELTTDKAKKIKEKLGVESEKSNLLCDIYNSKDVQHESRKQKIGFIRNRS